MALYNDKKGLGPRDSKEKKVIQTTAIGAEEYVRLTSAVHG